MQLKTTQPLVDKCPLESIHDIKSFEHYAQNNLPANVSAFFSGGAGDEITLKENISAFDRIKLLPRILRNVRERSLISTVLGERINFPLLIAPTAFQQLAHPEGEIAVASAAETYNVPMIVSTLSTSSFEEIRNNTTAQLWLQLYIYKDRDITKNLIQLAESFGFKGVVLTVDTPLYGKRTKELHNPLILPPNIEIKNLELAGLNLKNIPPTELTGHLASLLDPTVTWKEVSWLRSLTSLPIILKGLMHPKDLRIAIEHNIKAVVISNHGGRQLDTALSSIETLKFVQNITNGKVEVILDGGVRKGIDILKALALGATAIMIGRPILWGLAAGGSEGVKKVLSILKSELSLAMALCGYTSINQINEEILFLSEQF